MNPQAGFALRGRNPDVLTCIANLSNDEVFTPPELANRMLDSLAEAWAADNGGANIWANKGLRFLDPSTKSGVFLREITRRLTIGLAEAMPDLEERVTHVLTKQVFGIGITHLTSLLARRSVYCSKHANGMHSIAKGFTSDAGNIWFTRIEHAWLDGRCKYCGANQRDYDRGDELETHAYALIHTDNIKTRLTELFGADMQFDVVIGNPPYQLGQSGGEAIGSFAMPIYQKFVEAAKAIEPRYLCMVTPSRWFAGGRGLDDFRSEMLADRRLRILVDYPDSREVFAGVDIAGGISYFLWDASWNGKCEVTTISGGASGPPLSRYLNEYDILVRYNEAVPILERILGSSGGGAFDSLAKQVAPIQPFSIRTNFRGAPNNDGMINPVLIYQNGGTGFIERDAIPRNTGWVDQWKVFLSGTASEHGGQTDKSGTRRVFSRILIGRPGTACTETYLVAGRFRTKAEATNFAAYLRTKFVRFLVSLRTNTQHLYSERFAFVPKLPMNSEWTDEKLYQRYKLTKAEIAFIEKMIRPMAESDE
ncbi:Eco57I restriction-modification methylase domain-containing protein [Bradyrhizobium diazoefficiens]|uniref:site-specific DNA-methyltransferase (adenine-specific) n=1 Tax=Bradyrhizobium diazoefficiens TaxID=1355477 RepID=A0A810D282_9BRAD|nr:type III restriction endonuclease [Bradyrhizobium diazoefficiens]BCE51589.1 type III restriction endonuclease [Bradyrhizobium diazoefficiens]BCE95085.1 type III restriction endonuclease [Bradyrhizobium diazoefficiens]BCF30031.1 type III restriction endonuclease [Bradyrhizobium diazoefficiens]